MPKPVRPVYHLYRLLWSSLDLLFPPICGGCERLGVHWCNDCRRGTKEIQPPVCEICGQPMGISGVCGRCASTTPRFNKLRSWALYKGPVREAILHLKYRHNISLGIVLSEPLFELIENLKWDVDLVVPVPLGVARLSERGYNQAILIAKPLALRTGLRYNSKGLTRVRETRSQVGLSFDQRRTNVHKAFRGNRDLIANHNILIVDDVATSSATMDACGAALFEAGAEKVYGVTLARAS